MHFRTAASAAILACAAHASAEPKPYKLAMMPVLGMGLSRRDTNGYQPEQTVCGDGNTCAEACGAGYTECAAVDASIHCFNPDIKQKCCHDGTGNSCDEGYYCTQDTKDQTWCCPDKMSLAECAAAYKVDGGLKTPEVSTSTPAPTSTSTPTPEPTSSTPEPSSTPASSTPVTTEAPTTSSAVTTSSVIQPNTTIVYETPEPESSSVFTPISSASTSVWTGSNSTITSSGPTQPTEPTESAPAGTGNPPASTSAPPTGAASVLTSSPLLLLAAGMAALL